MSNENRIIGIEGICRACMTEVNELRSLFKVGKICGEITKLSVMLNECTSLEVDENDGLPGQICHKCVIQVSKAYNFKQICKKSDNVLRDKLKSIQEYSYDDNNEEGTDEMKINDMDHEIENTEITEIYTYEEYEGIPMLTNQLDSQIDESIDIKEENIDEDSEIDLNQGTDSEKESSQSISEHFDIIDTNLEANNLLLKMNSTSSQNLVFKNDRSRSRRHIKSFKCNICLKVLSNSSSFKYHMQLHSDKTPFLCNECGQGFKTKNAYDGHMITHNINNPFSCDICGKVYRQAASLKCHMLVHTGEKPFLCGVCGKGMTQKSGYKKHMLVHTGEKPHHCDLCGKNFRFSSNLIMHKRSHTGQRPFACSVCDKRFPGSEALKRHSFIHTGEKPFACDFCGRCFNRKSSLLVHRNIHTGLKQHSCLVCPKRFIQLHALQSHMTSHRQDQSI